MVSTVLRLQSSQQDAGVCSPRGAQRCWEGSLGRRCRNAGLLGAGGRGQMSSARAGSVWGLPVLWAGRPF